MDGKTKEPKEVELKHITPLNLPFDVLSPWQPEAPLEACGIDIDICGVDVPVTVCMQDCGMWG